MPFVSIIIVNFNGRQLLPECLNSLNKLSYPKSGFEVVMVDNASTDDSVPFIQNHYPWVKLVKSPANLGFTGGNNLGLANAKGEYIVLLNSDTYVDKDWLTALVKSAYRHPKTGLFSSRIRFAVPFLKIRLVVPPIQRSEIENSIDFSPLGLLLENISCNPTSLDSLVWYNSGFYEKKNGNVISRWSQGDSSIFLPVSPGLLKKNRDITYKITLHGYQSEKAKPAQYKIFLGEKDVLTGEIPPYEVKQVTLKIPTKLAKTSLQWFIQNAGNVVLHDGYAKDRGSLIVLEGDEKLEYYEPESPYFFKEVQVLAVCGAACLIKRKLIEQIGFLDPDYFMYYEDIELSLRAWLQGWGSMYVPNALVYHHHKATTKKTSLAFLLHLTERNHLYLTFTHFPFPIFLEAAILFTFRFMLNVTKTLFFYLTGDIERYERWREQTRGRSMAFRDFFGLIPKLIWKKIHFSLRPHHEYKEMRKLMY